MVNAGIRDEGWPARGALPNERPGWIDGLDSLALDFFDPASIGGVFVGAGLAAAARLIQVGAYQTWC